MSNRWIYAWEGKILNPILTTHGQNKEVCLVAKKVIDVVKLQIPAGAASPAPPVGLALGQAGINISGVTKELNARTQDQQGTIILLVIPVDEDGEYTFVAKTPQDSVYLNDDDEVI